MKVHYEFTRDKFSGARNFSDVEVSKELGAVLAELDQKEYNLNRKETRRHESLSCGNDKLGNLVDETVNIEKDFIENMDYKKLHIAIKQLLPQQQELLKKVFFDGVSMAEIARQEGVTEGAIRDRLNKIKNKLKKILI